MAYKIVLLWSLILGAFFTLEAKNKVAVGPPTEKAISHQLKIDSSKIIKHSFNQPALDQYNKDPAFNYQTDTDKSDSLWDKFWKWFWHMIENLLSQSDHSATPSAGPIVKVILLGVVLAAIIYAIIKFTGLDGIFRRKQKDIELPYSESLQNIHEITFDEEIEKAMAQHNYRLAVRLLYLRSLKQLNDAGLIDWQIEKTNSTYLNELPDDEKKQSFSLLTRQFEYVWYGDFKIDGTSFQNINTLFIDFKRMLP